MRIEVMAPKNILVIDDDADVVELIATALRLEGYCVDEAETREEIIERLVQASDYDLIITDVWMPGMYGLQVANFAQMVGTDTPVLFISGFADPSLEERVRVFGEQARLLRKPFDAKVLLRCVEEMLAQQPRPQNEAFTP